MGPLKILRSHQAQSRSEDGQHQVIRTLPGPLVSEVENCLMKFMEESKAYGANGNKFPSEVKYFAKIPPKVKASDLMWQIKVKSEALIHFLDIKSYKELGVHLGNFYQLRESIKPEDEVSKQAFLGNESIVLNKILTNFTRLKDDPDLNNFFSFLFSKACFNIETLEGKKNLVCLIRLLQRPDLPGVFEQAVALFSHEKVSQLINDLSAFPFFVMHKDLFKDMPLESFLSHVFQKAGGDRSFIGQLRLCHTQEEKNKYLRDHQHLFMTNF